MKRMISAIGIIALMVFFLTLNVVNVVADQSKIRADFLEKLETIGEEEVVSCTIDFIRTPALAEMDLPKLIAQKYGIKTTNAQTLDEIHDYMKYRYIEIESASRDFLDGFFEDYKDGICEIEHTFYTIHPFCFLSVKNKSVIYEMANDERVLSIYYVEDEIQIPAAELPEEVVGDVTDDGNLDMKDVLATRKHLVNAELGQQFKEEKADVNLDNSVDMKDVLLMRLLIVSGFDRDV